MLNNSIAAATSSLIERETIQSSNFDAFGKSAMQSFIFTQPTYMELFYINFYNLTPFADMYVVLPV